jgi:DNA-binding response OmpR family regulator
MRFGQVEFDATCGRLSVAGHPVKLDRSCRAILVVLAGAAGQDVHKDRLLEAGWPGRVVDENSLAKAISRLRRALGDNGETLQTVHGYGYRLDIDLAPKLVASDGAQIALHRFRWPILALSVGVLAALAVVWSVTWANDTQRTEEQRLIKGEPADSIGRVLWVDDNPQNNTKEKRFLEQRKLAVYQVETSEDALALLAMYEYGAVVSDMNRADEPLAGLELVREMRRRRDTTPFIIYTVVPSAAQRKLVTEAGGQRAVATSAELYDAVLPLFNATSSRDMRE